MPWPRTSLLIVTFFGVMTSCLPEERKIVEPLEKTFLAGNGLPQLIGSEEKVLLQSILELSNTLAGLPLDIQNRVMLEISIAVFWTIFWIGFVGLAYAAVEGDKKNEDEEESSRELLSSPWPDRTHALFGLTILLGEATGRYDCLNRLACLDEARASDVLSLSNMFLVGAKSLHPLLGYSQEDLHYMSSEIERMNSGMEKASEYRRRGGKCDAMYTCEEVPSI